MANRYFIQNTGHSQYGPPPTRNPSTPTISQYQDNSRSIIPNQNFSVPPPHPYQNQSIRQSAHSVNFSHSGNQGWGQKFSVQESSDSFRPFCDRTPYLADGQQSNTKDMSHMTAVQADGKWVHSYLSSIGKAHSELLKSTVDCDEKMEPKLKVCDAKESVDIYVSLLQNLENLENKLSASINTLSSEEWENIFLTVELKKQQLSAILKRLDNPLTIAKLHLALDQRQKKRRAQKRKRILIKQYKTEARAKRKKLHESIDGWLEEMQLSVEKIRSEESLKMQADLVLADVTRKEVEARRQLTLLSTLLKLRQLRVQAANSRGERISAEQVNIYENVTKNLQTFWSNQLKGYHLEEKGLKVMLEEETQEQVKRNGTSLRRGTFIQWQKVLFGQTPRVDNDYTLAERNMDFFIAVRRDWDKFLTSVPAPMSTSIPVGWVVPVKPSLEQWEKFLVK